MATHPAPPDPYELRHAAWDDCERRMTPELSMTITMVAALVIGELFSMLVISPFVRAVDVLEGLTVGRGRRAIRDPLPAIEQGGAREGRCGPESHL
jgi:hypothetical protein